MMKPIALSCGLLLFGNLVIAAKEPWRDPAVNEINRLPARALLVPCESEAMAREIAVGAKDWTNSHWVASLDGIWNFAYSHTVGAPVEKRTTITVPSCWQLQGDYDPPLYTTRYPIKGFETGDPMVEPPKDWTSYHYRNPVGVYERSFRVPSDWSKRRTVLRFLGVYSAFEVEVNGKFVGYAEDSRLPSEFDISSLLRKGATADNNIKVKVYKHSDGSFLEDQDFWRMSGIYRSVFLVSEALDAPKDLFADTRLSDDYTKGELKLVDEKGAVVFSHTYDCPRLWTHETPNLHTEVVKHQHDFYAVTFGFRRVEIRNAQILLNGRRVVFNGVDRHEMNPERGYTLTKADQLRDLQLLKEFNFNAIRTCHYPDLPEWYDLCDREGILVLAEANVESHGAGWTPPKTLAVNPRYLKAHVERNVRMVKFYRNHPSIFSWSLGNEAGMGKNFEEAYKAVKQLDPTRPVQYYLSAKTPFSDVFVQMYPSYLEAEKAARKFPNKPHLMQECAHAMGNSTGDFKKLWDVAEKCPNFQGGFVWDFADQALWKNGKWRMENGELAEGRHLAYGGDFGDVPNKANVHCNGVFDALRNPHPGAFEIKHTFQPVRVTAFDWKRGVARVQNRRVFTGLDDLVGKVELQRKGWVFSSHEFPLKGFAPGEEREIDVEGAFKNADEITFRFFRNCGDGGQGSARPTGRVALCRDRPLAVAWDQFVKPFVPWAKRVGTWVPDHPFKFNFWRVPTDNDRGWKMEQTCKLWRDATESQKLPEGVESDLQVERDPFDGSYNVDWTLKVPKKLPPIPRVGLTFTVPKAERVEWYGMGPWENYADRATAALLARYTGTTGIPPVASERTGTTGIPPVALNPGNYIKPCEHGYRTGTRYLKVGDVEVSALNAPFGFNVWPYSQQRLQGPDRVSEIHGAGGVKIAGLTTLTGNLHQFDLVEEDRLTVNIDAVQMGVGGDQSWGAKPHSEYLPGAGVYRLMFKVKGEIQ